MDVHGLYEHGIPKEQLKLQLVLASAPRMVALTSN